MKTIEELKESRKKLDSIIKKAAKQYVIDHKEEREREEAIEECIRYMKEEFIIDLAITQLDYVYNHIMDQNTGINTVYKYVWYNLDIASYDKFSASFFKAIYEELYIKHPLGKDKTKHSEILRTILGKEYTKSNYTHNVLIERLPKSTIYQVKIAPIGNGIPFEHYEGEVNKCNK
jgi:hypothetical protein